MTPIENDIEEYLLWLGVHNYAKTTIRNRQRYLAYLVSFLKTRAIQRSPEVTLEVLKEYQNSLFNYRKANGEPLSFGTQ